MARHYEDTDTRRRQVAEAALRTIAEDGVSRFTTRAVAERVGISDSTLFRHFGNKEEIVLEAMSILEAEMTKGLLETGDMLADLEGFFRHRAAFVGAEASVGRLIFSDEFVHLAGEAARSCIKGWRATNIGFLATRLKPLQDEGVLRADLDVAAMSMFIQGTLLTFAMQATLGTASEAHLDAQIDKAWISLQAILCA
jgi:AcrR family transcriptional regulator